MDGEERLRRAVRTRVDLLWWRVRITVSSRGVAQRVLILTWSVCGFRDGHYGLYLDETLYEGSSARCPTFNNDPLCSSSGPSPDGGGGDGTATFECVGLEVWGVGPS